MSCPRWFLTSSFVALALSGCGQPPESDEGASAAAALTTEQTGTDVQVLQIWTPGRAFPSASHGWLGGAPGDVSLDADDPRVCNTLRTFAATSAQAYESREVDCTGALAAKAPFDVTGVPGPVMTPARFILTKRLADGYVFADPDYCNRIELRVVVRDAAAAQPSFAGIGFWSSHGDSFAPSSELQAVGQTRLARGDAATIYRFSGISTCVSSAHGSTSGNMYQTFSFKPYVAYDRRENGEVTRYRVWEDIRGNHTIGRSWPGAVPRVDALGFDRQEELLAR
jgi:hypothetical protein